MVAGAGLRACAVEDALVWHDEVFTQVFAAGNASEDWLPLFDGEVRPVGELRAAREHDPARSQLDTAAGLARDEPQHPPLYYLAARLAGGGGTGVTEAAAKLRWLSVLFGLLALLPALWLARELFEHRARQVVAVGLFALSPVHVLYAQEAREYALWTVWILASTAALLRARRVGTAGAYAAYGTLLALGLYTSFAMATVLLGHGLFVGAAFLRSRDTEARRATARAVTAWAAALLFFAPWAWLLVEHWEAFQASMAWSRTIRVPVGELLGTFGLNLSRTFGETGADALGFSNGALLVVVLVAAGVGAWSLRERPDALACLLGLFLGPVLFLLVPDLVMGGIRSISTRYLLPSSIALGYLVAAVVPRERTWWRWGVAVLLLGVGALGAFTAARDPIPWSKGISRRLPEVAAVLERHPNALLVGDHERHHPGHLLTLSGMVPDGTRVQLLGTVEHYRLADHEGPIFLLDPSPRFRRELERSAGVRLEPEVRSLHVNLWRVHR